MLVVQVLLLLLLPAVAQWVCRWRGFALVGPVIVCYGMGLLLGQVIAFRNEWLQNAAGGVVLLGLALLLVSADLKAWLRLARATMISAALTLVAAAVTSLVVGLLVISAAGPDNWMAGWPNDWVTGEEGWPDSWKVAGMLTGVYTGGTANMMAIGTALKVDIDVLMVVNAADIVLSGMYFFLLLLVGGRIHGRFLRVAARADTGRQTEAVAAMRSPTVRGIAGSIGLGLVLVAVSGSVGFLVPDTVREAVICLIMTTVAIALSFYRPIRQLPGAFQVGNYALLIFCVAVGAMTTIDSMLTMPAVVFGYTACVFCGSIAVHTLLCAIFGIDRDTCIITSVAAIFSPAFVGPVAVRLRNPQLVVSGVTAGLLGFAAGNYLGLAIAHSVHALAS